MKVDKLKAVLEYCSKSYDKPGSKTGTRTAIAVTTDLLAIANSLAKELAIDEKSDLKVTVSYGAGYFPKCLWVGVVPKKRAVSNSMSVCICLGGRGDGVVVGAMFPQPRPTGQYATVKRSKNPKRKVGLRVPSARRSYEDCFLNPLEMTVAELNGQKIIDQMKSSIALLREYLDYVDNITKKK